MAPAQPSTYSRAAEVSSSTARSLPPNPDRKITCASSSYVAGSLQSMGGGGFGGSYGLGGGSSSYGYNGGVVTKSTSSSVSRKVY